MKLGTKSVLFGAHCFFLHPFFVAAAWAKLYGFPYDPRLWLAFIVHDLGYIGKPNMDGIKGEQHPVLGAKICGVFGRHWYEFCLFHSRYFAKKHNAHYSRLCVADKLSFVMTPKWLYLPMVKATSEVYEYLQIARHSRDKGERFFVADHEDAIEKWYHETRTYLLRWAAKHRHMVEDKWSVYREPAAESGPRACGNCGADLGYLRLADLTIQPIMSDIEFCDAVCHEEWMDAMQDKAALKADDCDQTN